MWTYWVTGYFGKIQQQIGQFIKLSPHQSILHRRAHSPIPDLARPTAPTAPLASMGCPHHTKMSFHCPMGPRWRRRSRRRPCRDRQQRKARFLEGNFNFLISLYLQNDYEILNTKLLHQKELFWKGSYALFLVNYTLRFNISDQAVTKQKESKEGWITVHGR